MLIMYIFYIVVMKFNVQLRELFVSRFPVEKWGLEPEVTSGEGDDDVYEDVNGVPSGGGAGGASFDQQDGTRWQERETWKSQSSFGAGASGYQTVGDEWSTPWSGGGASSADQWSAGGATSGVQKSYPKGYIPPSLHPNKYSLFEAANTIIIKHKRLFSARRRFIAAANLIITKNNKAKTARRLKIAKKAGPSKAEQKRVISQVRQDTVIGQ